MCFKLRLLRATPKLGYPMDNGPPCLLLNLDGGFLDTEERARVRIQSFATVPKKRDVEIVQMMTRVSALLNIAVVYQTYWLMS